MSTRDIISADKSYYDLQIDTS